MVPILNVYYQICNAPSIPSNFDTLLGIPAAVAQDGGLNGAAFGPAAAAVYSEVSSINTALRVLDYSTSE